MMMTVRLTQSFHPVLVQGTWYPLLVGQLGTVIACSEAAVTVQFSFNSPSVIFTVDLPFDHLEIVSGELQ